jgi:hypothetical protein
LIADDDDKKHGDVAESIGERTGMDRKTFGKMIQFLIDNVR